METIVIIPPRTAISVQKFVWNQVSTQIAGGDAVLNAEGQAVPSPPSISVEAAVSDPISMGVSLSIPAVPTISVTGSIS